MELTLYEILRIPHSATQSQIRRAYRTAARTLHPDTNPAPDAAKRFAEIAGAYQTLRDKDRRREYDDRLRRASASCTNGSGVGQPHYSWTNIAAAPPAPGLSNGASDHGHTDLDRMYDAFFKPRARE